MDEKKKVDIELEGALSEQTQEWADLLGLDVESGVADKTISQYLNDHIAQRLEELQNESESREEE